MGNPKVMYQVRADDGRIRTVIAQSHRGAVRTFLATSKYRAAKGEVLDVKRRGEGPDDWQSFKVR